MCVRATVRALKAALRLLASSTFDGVGRLIVSVVLKSFVAIGWR